MKIVKKNTSNKQNNNFINYDKMRYVICIFIMLYLIFTFTMFLMWPINWPIYDLFSWIRLTTYILTCYISLVIGFNIGSKPKKNIIIKPMAKWQLKIILIGTISAVILLFPSSYIYTGHWPWDVVSSFGDQALAYRDLGTQLLETSGQRGPIAAARAILSPMTFAVIPLSILRWERLSLPFRILPVVTAGCGIVLSLMRGTDREFADLFIVASTTMLVKVVRQASEVPSLALLTRKYLLPGVMILLFLGAAGSLFIDRKSGRLGGFDNRITVCANTSDICANIDAPLVAWLPLPQRFGASIFVLSSASGFYGLSLGLEKQFEPTWGAGHSPASLAIYELLTGDERLKTHTYTYRNSYDGWSDENYWSTLILWIANDVGFTGAVFVLALLGFLWGKAWCDATLGNSDSAAVLHGLIMIMLVYLPANNQVFATYEGYTIFFVWLITWLRQRRTATI